MRYLIGILCLCGLLYGQLETEAVKAQKISPTDTLWCIRDKDTKVVLWVSHDRFSIVPIKGSNRFNIIGTMIRRNDKGDLVELESKARMLGKDTSLVEIRFTTEDSVRTDWNSVEWILDKAGTFVRQ